MLQFLVWSYLETVLSGKPSACSLLRHLHQIILFLVSVKCDGVNRTVTLLRHIQHLRDNAGFVSTVVSLITKLWKAGMLHPEINFVLRYHNMILMYFGLNVIFLCSYLHLQ